MSERKPNMLIIHPPFFRFPVLTGFGGAAATRCCKPFTSSFFFFLSFCLFAFLQSRPDPFAIAYLCCLSGRFVCHPSMVVASANSSLSPYLKRRAILKSLFECLFFRLASPASHT